MPHNRLIAEAMGTATLVFCGCAAIVVNDLYGQLGHLGVSLAFGLVVMAMIYSIGNISGAHINPAVTFGFLCAGRIKAKRALAYLVSQCIGALVAGLLLLLILLPERETLGATLPSVHVARAFAMEVALSFILMSVILNVSTGHYEKGIMAGVAIGGTIALEALLGGPLTGASMNPARSLGPALASGHLESLWIYLLVPVVGTFLAHPTCRIIQGDQCCPPDLDKDDKNV